jgi:hypothetical protein
MVAHLIARIAMYAELSKEFAGLPVVDYDKHSDWKGASHAYRLREEYDDKVSVAQRLESLLAQPGAAEIQALIIGTWSGSCEGGDSSEIVATVAASAARLPALKALFIGEMTYEECEISWINQTDISPLLRAFPRLEALRVRGGEGLSFSRVEHRSLRSLAVETGGLSQSTIHEILACEFPELQRIELLLGEENYGFDGSVEDFEPLLSGQKFPKLKYLGLMNSEIANDLAAAVAKAPIVGCVETIDLSLGNLDSEGVESLKALASQTNLKSLIISHHYATDEAINSLKSALPFSVIAEDKQEPDDEWRPILHAE